MKCGWSSVVIFEKQVVENLYNKKGLSDIGQLCQNNRINDGKRTDRAPIRLRNGHPRLHCHDRFLVWIGFHGGSDEVLAISCVALLNFDQTFKAQ